MSYKKRIGITEIVNYDGTIEEFGELVDLDKIIIDSKSNDVIKDVLDFQYVLESSDFYEIM